MTATSTQLQLNDAQQLHDLAFDQAAREACAKFLNRDRIDTSLLAAELYAARSADRTKLLQTIFRTPDTSGWWHTPCHAQVLGRAKVFATVLPSRYFH